MDIHSLWNTQHGGEPGSKCTGSLPVCGGGAELPITLIFGARPGPAVLISAGVHNAEYVGIQAVMELAQELTPEQLSGSVALIHLMNPTGFAHRTMSLVYEDEKNLNRVFPGQPDGTLAERIAHTVTECFFRRADAYIDLHSGDGYEELAPYVYCQGAASPTVALASQRMAEQVDVPYLIHSTFATGGAYNHAGSMGVPGILIERGGLGLWSREQVDADKQDVRRVLHHIGVLAEGPAPLPRQPAPLGQIIYETAQHTGCWYPLLQVGDRIQAGQTLGQIRDCFGNHLQTCRAKMDGVLLYQTKSLCILQDGPMVTYGTFK